VTAKVRSSLSRLSGLGTLLPVATGSFSAACFDEIPNVKFRANTSGFPVAHDDQLRVLVVAA
jgi:hypothetical protein